MNELATGVSRAATLRTLGIPPPVVPANVLDSVNAMRRLLSRAFIDETRCARSLAALQACRREWHEATRSFKPKPLQIS